MTGPTQNTLKLGDICPFEQLEKRVFCFEAILKEHNVPIKKGSDLEKICLSIIDILGKKQCPDLMDPLQDIRKDFADILGLWMFLDKVITLQKHPDFGKLIPHLRLLNEGVISQNTKSPISDAVSNKIFELLFAFLCMEIGQDILLDSPSNSKGDNPDIIVTIDGLRWGFACKVPYSQSAESIYSNICNGIGQIEASPATTIGCVVLNFRNLIDHNRSWPILNEDEYKSGKQPIFGAYTDHMFLAQELAVLAHRKEEEIKAKIGIDQVIATFKGKKTIPATLVFLHTATGIVKPPASIPTPSSIKMFYLCRFDNLYTPVFEMLNNALHNPFTGTI